MEEIWSAPGEKNNIASEEELNTALIKCDDLHKKRFTYDVCISYAGEDIHIAGEMVTGLKSLTENKVFFDRDEEADL